MITGAALLLALTGSALLAQPFAQSQEAPVLDGIRHTYQNAALDWLPRLVPVAQRLFMLLAGLEFAVSGAVWALRRESLDDVAGKFLLKFTLIAFLLALITGFDYWIPPLVNGFAAAGEHAIGQSTTVNPSDVIDIGRENSMLVLKHLRVSVVLQDPAMAIYGSLSALIIALSFMAVAAQLTLVMIESYIVLGAGVLFLGFAAFRGTASFAENLIAYALHIGVKIFFLYLVVGIGTELTRSWPALIESSDFFGPASPLFQVVGGALIFAVLAIVVPTTVAGRLAVRPSIGIAHALRALS
ncbi:MAG TPA: P-type conjugative transfer protein TrbL [Gemmatimonadaceae bacterium]|jgi:type IV secretion system protein TrbL